MKTDTQSACDGKSILIYFSNPYIYGLVWKKGHIKGIVHPVMKTVISYLPLCWSVRPLFIYEFRYFLKNPTAL